MDRAKEYMINKQVHSRREQRLLDDLEDRILVVLEACDHNPTGRDWQRFTPAQEEYIESSALNERNANELARNCLAFMMSEDQHSLFAFGF